MAGVDFKKLIQELVVPEIRELKSEIRVLQTENKRIEEKIDSLRNEMRAEFRRVDEKIDLSLQVRERLVALEAKMAALESRN